MDNILKVGAVIYAPRVTVIWGIIADFFKGEGFEIEPIYFKDYRMQVDALIKGEIDIAWNSPLAWLETNLRTKGTCLNGSMRDTDRDRSSYLVVKKSSNIKTIEDLRGKTIGFGAFDSPQARLIPLYNLYLKGLESEKDFVEKRFDLGVGLDGDHIGGELDALESLKKDEIDASWMLDLNFSAWSEDGTLDKNEIEVLYETPKFDHCIFSGRPDLSKDKFEKFIEVLHKMDYSNPNHKEMMDMEGLKEWVPGRLIGFEQLTNANIYLKFFGELNEK